MLRCAIAAIASLTCLLAFFAAAAEEYAHVVELPYGPGEGVTSVLPLTYRSSALLHQQVSLDGVTNVFPLCALGAERNHVEMRVADVDVARIEGRFVRSVGGYHGRPNPDYEWRSRSPAKVALGVERIGSELRLRCPSWRYIHHEASFEKLVIAVPAHLAAPRLFP